MASDTLLPLRQTTETKKGSQQGEDSDQDFLQNRPRRKAISKLEPALYLLERFHHRNKNQHRVNKWWSEADMLRRQIRKILEGLHVGLGDEERGVWRLEMLARKGPTSGVKKGKGKEKEQEKEKVDERGFKIDEFGIYERAGYIRGLLVPRAWLAFTQLVADRQFAQLGMMLLATLAQIDQALWPFAPGPELDGVEEGEAAGLQNERETLLAAAVNIGAAEETGEDVGVAISRSDFLLSTITSSTQGKTAEEEKAAAERLERLETRRQGKKIMGYDLDTDGDVDGGMDIDDNDMPSSPMMVVSAEREKFTNITAIKAQETEGEDEERVIDTKKKKRPRFENEHDSHAEDEEWDGISDGGDQNDDIGSIFASLIPTKKEKKVTTKMPPSSKSIIEAKKKKQEEEKEPDDIGSVFDSLIPKKATKKKSSSTATTASVKAKSKEGSKEKSTEKKKKKKKQGDEFDDIFGGLL